MPDHETLTGILIVAVAAVTMAAWGIARAAGWLR